MSETPACCCLPEDAPFRTYEDVLRHLDSLGLFHMDMGLGRMERALHALELDNLRGAIKETCARIGVEHTGDLTADAQGIWRAIDRLKSLLSDSVPRAAYERRLARRQRQIDECHAALRRRLDAIARLASENDALSLERAQMRPRLMPEGMEWPVFEDGEPVRIGDEISWRDEGGVVNSIELQDGGYFIIDGRVFAPQDIPLCRKCTACGKQFTPTHRPEWLRYCPYCGARITDWED